MVIKLEKYQFIDILREASQLGAEQAIVKSGLLMPYLTQNSAYKMYGRRAVDAWIREGSIVAHKSGERNSRVLLDRLELSMLAKADKFMVYIRQAA